MTKIVIYKGKLSDIIKEMKEDIKNGKSERAKTEFFSGDSNFFIDDLLSYIYDNLKEDGKAVIFCSIEELSEIFTKYKHYKFSKIQPLIFIKIIAQKY